MKQIKMPLANRPFFPHQVIPLIVDNEPWAKTIKAVADSSHKILGLVMVKTDKVSDAKTEDFFTMGTACKLHRIVQVDDKLQIVVEGLQRFRIEDWASEEPPLVVKPSYPLYNEELRIFLQRFSPEEPSPLADFAASLTTSSKTELQEILENVHILKRLEKVMLLLSKELQRAKAQVDIRKQVEEKMQDHQRDFFLHEQLKAIKKELGLEKDDSTAESEKFNDGKRLTGIWDYP